MILSRSANPSGFYDVLLILHIVTLIVGFGSTFVLDMMGARSGEAKGEEALYLSRMSNKVADILTSPFIYATGVLGVLLVVFSDDVFSFSDTWISIAFVLYFAGLANSHLFIKPIAKKMLALQEELAATSPPPAGEAPGGPPPQVTELGALGKRTPMHSGISHLLLVAILWVMIIKPGWP
ncbi:MAG TPA: hypothetical protein VGA13_07485 [Acidimicrobiales bacterium]